MRACPSCAAPITKKPGETFSRLEARVFCNMTCKREFTKTKTLSRQAQWREARLELTETVLLPQVSRQAWKLGFKL